MFSARKGLIKTAELSAATAALICLAAAFLLAIVVGVYTLFAVGFGVSWSSGGPFTQREALGFPLFGAVMSLTVLPLLASAARMPGTYAEHFHPRLRKGTA